jgi:hypothetical protein
LYPSARISRVISLDIEMCIVIDDTSKFACTGGPLKNKDQIGRTAHEDVRSNKQYKKSLIVTAG